MTSYIRTNAGRIFKFEDHTPIAELVKGFWVVPSPLEEGEKGIEKLSEETLAEFTHIPGDFITSRNVGPLWDFANEVANLATSQSGYLKGYVCHNLVKGELPSQLSDDIRKECIACSYLIYCQNALKQAYPHFQLDIGENFLRYYAYQILWSLSKGDLPEPEAFYESFQNILLDYEDASNDPNRIEKVFAPSWRFKTNKERENRILFCLANRVYLRAKGIPEDKLAHKEDTEIPDLDEDESLKYLNFALKLGRISNAIVFTSPTLRPVLDQNHEA